MVGIDREQFGSLVVRVPELVAPLAHFGRRRQDTIHGSKGAQVGARVQERRVDFGRSPKDESVRVQDVKHFLPFPLLSARGGAGRFIGMISDAGSRCR